MFYRPSSRREIAEASEKPHNIDPEEVGQSQVEEGGLGAGDSQQGKQEQLGGEPHAVGKQGAGAVGEQGAGKQDQVQGIGDH